MIQIVVSMTDEQVNLLADAIAQKVGATATGPSSQAQAVSFEEAARILGVNKETIRRRANAGTIKLADLGGAARRIPMSEINRILEGNARQ